MQSGIQISRSSSITLVGRAIDLLRPSIDAQCRHLLQSRVLAMDETPIKAGREKKGKMHQAYFWPMYGDADKMSFHCASSAAHYHAQAFLGVSKPPCSVTGTKPMRPMPGNRTV